MKATVPQTGKETGATPVSNLVIYFYDDKHAQFPSYTTENASSQSLWNFTQ